VTNGALPRIDIVGKRTLDYVIDALAKSNTGSSIILRALGTNLAKGVAVSEICFWQVGLAHFGGLIWPTMGR
jgi:DNA-binding protein